MAESTGFILAAAGIAVVNEVVFVPLETNKPMWSNFNWRVIPATGIAVVTLAGLEKISPPLGKGLAMLALLAVLIVPIGNAPSPVENAIKYLNITSG